MLVFLLKNIGPEERKISLGKTTYTDDSANLCYEPNYHNLGTYSGIPLRGDGFLDVKAGERIQFIVAALPCRSSTFTGRGTVDVELVFSEDGKSSKKATRFSIFDVPFKSN